MTVSELMEQLEDMNPDAEVRLAIQPSWPLQFNLRGVVDSADDDSALVEWQNDHDQCDEVDWAHSVCSSCDDTFKQGEDEDSIVYLMQGDHPSDDSPYAPKALWDMV
jgi:hypothetical protein